MKNVVREKETSAKLRVSGVKGLPKSRKTKEGEVG